MEFALLQVGINAYPLGNELRGCVNDCLNLSAQFKRLGWQSMKWVRLIDANATRINILESLRWLVRQDAPTLIFQYSGHGTRIWDRGGDESSRYDSAICPVDLFTNGVITDDELADIYALVPADRKLVILSDSCHSGKSQRAFLARWKSRLLRASTPRFIPTEMIPPNILLALDTDQERARAWFSRRKSFLKNNERCVLLSTCREDQTSADAWIEGKWQGAGTAALLYGWNRAGQGASYRTIAEHANTWLKGNKYEQVVRVEGTTENASKSIFQ